MAMLTLAPVFRGEGRVRGGPALDDPTNPATERQQALLPLIRPTATFSPEYRGEEFCVIRLHIQFLDCLT